MSIDQHSFRVHLQSLRDFARELSTQLDAIGGPSDGLTELAAHPVALGAFAEGDSLRDRHQDAVTQMQSLLSEVSQAISFANDVTTTVADSYEQTDQQVAAALGRHQG